MRYALFMISRVFGSAWIWISGTFAWRVVGLIWCIVSFRENRIDRALAFLLVCGLGGGLGVLALPLVFGFGEWIGKYLGRC